MAYWRDGIMDKREMTRQIASGQKSEPQKLDATRDLKPDNNTPTHHYATTPIFPHSRLFAYGHDHP
jgi:hypothetical protein